MKNDLNVKKQRESRAPKQALEKILKPAPGQSPPITEASTDRLRMLAADRLRHFETLR